MKILYVEDDASSVRVIQRIARHLGDTLVLATNAAEATTLLGSDLDLILTDINLPDMEGTMLIKLMRSQLPDVPIIAITAHAMRDDHQKCLDAGCNAYLSKPFDFPAIVGLLQTYRK